MKSLVLTFSGITFIVDNVEGHEQQLSAFSLIFDRLQSMSKINDSTTKDSFRASLLPFCYIIKDVVIDDKVLKGKISGDPFELVVNSFERLDNKTPNLVIHTLKRYACSSEGSIPCSNGEFVRFADIEKVFDSI
jgi:hypothetical protein